MSPDRLSVIRIAASHPDISLFTLNAPQDSINDVTPLGMAAWLDMPNVVQLLLDCSSGAVSVDAMDTDGATPLMCTSPPSLLPRHPFIPTPDAARDCRIHVVHQLVGRAQSCPRLIDHPLDSSRMDLALTYEIGTIVLPSNLHCPTLRSYWRANMHYAAIVGVNTRCVFRHGLSPNMSHLGLR